MSDYVKPQSPMLIGDTHFYPLTTIDQIIKSDDARLSEDDLGLSMELLWTNASPTSSFSAQTISVDLSEYKFACIVFYDFVNGIYGYTTYIASIGLGSFQSVSKYGVTSSGSYDANYQERVFTVNTNSIEFSNGFYGPDKASSNAYIPYKIYGVK